MASFIPESLAKNGVIPSLAEPTESMIALHMLSWKLDKQVKGIQAAASNKATAVKVVPAFDSVSANDEKGKLTANKLVRAFLTAIEKEVTANPSVAYWLAESLKQVSQFTTSEVNFYRWNADKSAPKQAVNPNSQAVAVIKSDRKDAVTFAKKLVGLMPTVMDELVALDVTNADNTDWVKLTKSGKNGVELNLPNIQGRGSGESDSPAGKFASLLFMVFTVNDETFPVGTDSRIVLRAIFTGVDRIGKRPSDLYDAMLAANGGSSPKNAGDTVEFTLGGKKVRAIRTSLTEDELPDMDNEDDDSEETE